MDSSQITLSIYRFAILSLCLLSWLPLQPVGKNWLLQGMGMLLHHSFPLHRPDRGLPNHFPPKPPQVTLFSTPCIPLCLPKFFSINILVPFLIDLTSFPIKSNSVDFTSFFIFMFCLSL